MKPLPVYRLSPLGYLSRTKRRLMGRLSPSGGKPAQSRRRKAASGRHRAALSVKDQELNAVLDTIDYGILFMGPDLRAKLINRAFRRMWKISDEFIRDTRPTMRDII